MKWSRKALLLKIETVYGTDIVPTGAANAQLIYAEDVNLTPINAQAVEREVVRAAGDYGAFTQFLVGKHVMLEFSVETAGGGGAVDLPPKYGPALRGCGLAEVISAGVKVTYTPVSESQESVTIYMHIDGILHKLLGARGDVEWNYEINKRPSMRFRFLGLFAAAADVAFPTPVYTGFTKPLVVSDTNTPTLTLHAAAVKAASLKVALGNQVEYRELVNSTEIVISGRKSSSQIVLEHAPVATKDWFGIITGETLGALALVHGLVAGNIINMDAPNAQLMNPRLSGSQDIGMLSLDMALSPTAGDDEVVYTTK
jgi:hypothetical protein